MRNAFCAKLACAFFWAVGSCQVSASGLEVGAFTGGGGSTPLAANFENWLGRRSDFNVDFIADQAYTGSNSLTSSATYTVSKWVATNRPDRNMLFSIPLSTMQDPSLRNVALGLYDLYFFQTARTIAKSYPKAIIRIGWEFNGNWYPWAASSHPQDYVAAFRRVAQIFKSISPNFRIDWCPSLGSLAMAAENAYPGDDVVDVIGMDVYNDWRYSTQNNSAQRWTYILNEDHGLAWQASFAKTHNKPMSFPEWAVNHDDPNFAQMIFLWIGSHNFVYLAYWDSNSGFAGDLDDNQYQNLVTTYRQLFSPLPRGQ